MTFSAGTLNSIGGGGSGSTNDTPWNLDHDGNQFSLTNLGGLRMEHASGTAVSMLMTNTDGSFRTTADGGGVQFDISLSSSAYEFKINTVSLIDFSSAGITPRTSSQSVGTSGNRFESAYIGGTVGLNFGGVTLTSGSGSPQGARTEPVGSIYSQTNGAAGTVIWVKETGVGNTGWVNYKSSATGTIPTTIAIACSDLVTAITAGTFKGYIRMPYAMTVTSVKASLASAQTAGSIFTVDINESGTTILSTKITIDATEKTSTTAVTAPVVSDTALANDAEISVDVDQSGTSPKGLVVYLEGFR
jgi:hypothetical protein